MIARVYTGAVIDLDGVSVDGAVDYTSGFPGMTLVGLPDAAVQESHERVQAAVKNAGLGFPRKRVIVNLAPASVRKGDPNDNLPIALGMLVHIGVLNSQDVEGTLVVGQLSLEGTVRHVRGGLPRPCNAPPEGPFDNLVLQ